MTMEFRTVSHRTSVLSMSLDCTLESFTFGNSGCINFVSSCKYISFDLASKCIFLCVVKSELSDISLSGYTSFCKMSHLSLVNAMSVNDFFLSVLVLVDDSFLLVNKANLYCAVTVVLCGLHLCYYTRSSLKYCYGN